MSVIFNQSIPLSSSWSGTFLWIDLIQVSFFCLNGSLISSVYHPFPSLFHTFTTFVPATYYTASRSHFLSNLKVLSSFSFSTFFYIRLRPQATHHSFSLCNSSTINLSCAYPAFPHLVAFLTSTTHASFILSLTLHNDLTPHPWLSLPKHVILFLSKPFIRNNVTSQHFLFILRIPSSSSGIFRDPSGFKTGIRDDPFRTHTCIKLLSFSFSWI